MNRKAIPVRGHILAACLFLCNILSLQAQTFRTVESGNYCTAMAKDADDNIYISRYNADDISYEIVRYTAGTGTPAIIYSGLDFNAVDYPWGLAVAGNGDVYIAASNEENKIIKLTYNSTLDDYAPSDLVSGDYYSALALDAEGNLYTAEYDGSDNYAVVRYDAGSTTGTALYGSLHLGGAYPTGLAVAPNGDIYVTDGFNSATGDNGHVYKLTASASYAVSTISSGKFSTSLALDPEGNLYCSEYDGSTSFVLNKYTGGSGTPATIATLLINSGSFYPWGIAALNSGNIYYATGNDDSGSGGAVMQLIDVPEAQASGIVFSDITTSSVTASWNRGTGSRSVVFIAETGMGNPLPVDNTTYTANAVYGSGSQIAASGWYCVYNGADTAVTITGLDPATTYRVMTIAYNGPGGSEQYNTATGSNIDNLVTDDALPVALSFFDGRYQNGEVQLSWETQTERNNRQFRLQWSLDGKSWSNIGTVATRAAGGNSNGPLSYSFVYSSPVAGMNLFRLRQEDLDGRTTFAATAQVMVNGEDEFLVLSPNPTKGIFTINAGGRWDRAEVWLLDAEGRTLKKWAAASGMSLDISAEPSGTYFIKLLKGTSVITRKIVKE